MVLESKLLIYAGSAGLTELLEYPQIWIYVRVFEPIPQCPLRFIAGFNEKNYPMVYISNHAHQQKTHLIDCVNIDTFIDML